MPISPLGKEPHSVGRDGEVLGHPSKPPLDFERHRTDASRRRKHFPMFSWNSCLPGRIDLSTVLNAYHVLAPAWWTCLLIPTGAGWNSYKIKISASCTRLLIVRNVKVWRRLQFLPLLTLYIPWPSLCFPSPRNSPSRTYVSFQKQGQCLDDPL